MSIAGVGGSGVHQGICDISRSSGVGGIRRTGPEVLGLDGGRLYRCVPVRKRLAFRKIRTRPATIRMYNGALDILWPFLAVL